MFDLGKLPGEYVRHYYLFIVPISQLPNWYDFKNFCAHGNFSDLDKLPGEYVCFSRLFIATKMIN